MNRFISENSLSYEVVQYLGDEVQKQDIKLCIGLRLICRKNHELRQPDDDGEKVLITVSNSQFFEVYNIIGNVLLLVRLDEKYNVVKDSNILIE